MTSFFGALCALREDYGKGARSRVLADAGHGQAVGLGALGDRMGAVAGEINVWGGRATGGKEPVLAGSGGAGEIAGFGLSKTRPPHHSAASASVTRLFRVAVLSDPFMNNAG
jgi:hypothetical protein